MIVFASDETVKKVNGKPHLRSKIRVRVLVWWPTCDFCFENRIPTLVELGIASNGAPENLESHKIEQ